MIEHQNLQAIQERVNYQYVKELFLKTLDSDNTKVTYSSEIDIFFAKIGTPYISDITIQELAYYREQLLKTYLPATSAKKLSVLRKFFTFCYLAKLSKISPDALKYFAKSPRVRQDSSYEILTKREVKLILSSVDKDTSIGYRDYVILCSLIKLALREAELIDIELKEFSQVNDELTMLTVTGKGNKKRTIPVSPDLWEILKDFIAKTNRSFSSRKDRETYLFVSRKKGKLTTRGIRHLVKRYVDRAGIVKPISAHSFRHSALTDMALNKAPLLVIQGFAGHQDPKTTLRYLRKAKEITSEAHKYNSIPLD